MEPCCYESYHRVNEVEEDLFYDPVYHKVVYTPTRDIEEDRHDIEGVSSDYEGVRSLKDISTVEKVLQDTCDTIYTPDKRYKR